MGGSTQTRRPSTRDSAGIPPAPYSGPRNQDAGTEPSKESGLGYLTLSSTEISSALSAAESVSHPLAHSPKVHFPGSVPPPRSSGRVRSAPPTVQALPRSQVGGGVLVLAPPSVPLVPVFQARHRPRLGGVSRAGLPRLAQTSAGFKLP